MSCRRVVCDGCSTRLQGRNFCSECLSLRALGGQDSVATRSSTGASIGLGLLTLVSLSILVLAVFGAGFLLYMVG